MHVMCVCVCVVVGGLDLQSERLDLVYDRGWSLLIDHRIHIINCPGAPRAPAFPPCPAVIMPSCRFTRH